MRTAITSSDALIAQAHRGGEIGVEALKRELLSILGSLAFIADQLKDMQLLFKSTKQRRKDINIADLVEKVKRLFGALLDKAGVEVSVEQVGSPLVAKTTDEIGRASCRERVCQ